MDAALQSIARTENIHQGYDRAQNCSSEAFQRTARQVGYKNVLQLDKRTHLHVYERPLTCTHGPLWRSIAESCRRGDCVHRRPLDRTCHMRCHLHIARELDGTEIPDSLDVRIKVHCTLQVHAQHGIVLEMLFMSVRMLLCQRT